MAIIQYSTAVAVVLTLAVSVRTVTGFVSTPRNFKFLSPAKTQTLSTSTTLYYRDDVPPIGSAPKWETPNDFNQFLTQCTIQSFTFLLKSLKDDHAIRWLDNFTQPVFETPASDTGETTTNKGGAKPKISLAKAAESALWKTEQALDGHDDDQTTLEFPSLDDDDDEQVVMTKEEEEEGASVAAEELLLSEETPAVVEEELPMIGGELPDLSSSNVELFTSDNVVNEVPEPPLSDTGIENLYTSSGLTKKQNNPPIVQKNHFAPFGTKPKQQQQQQPKASRSPFGNIPGAHTTGGGFKPTPTTSPLYGGGGGASSTAASGNAANKSNNNKVGPGKATTPQQTLGSVLKYHGLGILNNTKFPTWDAYFEQLIDQPKALLTIETYNPRLPNIELDIDPAGLCRRMISVRAQIAQEFEHDLQVIADMGGLTLQSYNKMVQETREQEAEEKLQQQKDALENLMPKSMEDSISNNNGAKSSEDDVNGSKPPPPSAAAAQKPQMQRANLYFLERGVGDGDAANYAPSPLRKGNFDLLCLLATQEAIHRVLNDPTRQARKSPEHGSKQFLQDFYVQRILSHFSGDQRYGRSDDFVEELMACPPRMITVGNPNDDKPNDGHEDSLTKDLTYLVDPVLVAETILNEREVVALQWKKHLEEQTKTDHRTIQNMVLTKVMGGTVEECETVDSEGNNIQDEGVESCFE